MSKLRQSNIELLRIIAIFFVLIGHTGIALGGLLPTHDDLTTSPVQSMASLLLNSMSVGGVDIFVLISGWFGIHISRRGLGKFVYQVIFLLWGIYAAFLIMSKAPINIEYIKTCLGIYDGYWFVMAYLGLYILSPILNAFAETATKRQFGLLLIVFYLFQIHYCWIWGMVNYFAGYSIVFFCGLYLTARYVRLYPVETMRNHPWSIYAATIIGLAILSGIGIYLTGHPVKLLRYDNPMVIVASLAILTAFSKISIQKKWINALATSCFAVYIIHFHPLVFPYFKKCLQHVAAEFNGCTAVAAIFLTLCFVFLVCALVDRLRLISWNFISKIGK